MYPPTSNVEAEAEKIQAWSDCEVAFLENMACGVVAGKDCGAECDYSYAAYVHQCDDSGFACG